MLYACQEGFNKMPHSQIVKSKESQHKGNGKEQNSDENLNFCPKFHKRMLNDRNGVLHYFSALEVSGPSRLSASVLMRPLIDSIATFSLEQKLDPFGTFERDGPVTAIKWHPTQPLKVAVAAYRGKVAVLDVAQQNPMDGALSLDMTEQCGPLRSMDFCPKNPEWLLLAGGSRLTLVNLEADLDQRSEILHDTGHGYANYAVAKRFVTCDISSILYAAGQTTGILQLFDKVSHEEVFGLQIHQHRISHVEFSKHHEYLLATSSDDCTVKIWDLRKMKSTSGEARSLHILDHAPFKVNAASFSRFNGQRLLTSDYYSRIRVYALPGFDLERTIVDPYGRQLRSRVEASWHPLQDLIAVGSFPLLDSDDERRKFTFIHIFDANSGDLLHISGGDLLDAVSEDAVQLTQFSNDGRVLCSGTYNHVLLWRQPKTCDDDSLAAASYKNEVLIYGKGWPWTP